MRIQPLLLIVTLLVVPCALSAQAPERQTTLFGTPMSAPVHSGAADPDSFSRLTASTTRPVAGIGRPLLGAVVGLPLGMIVGGGLGYAIGPREVEDGCMFLCVGSGPAVGIALGTTLGAGAGAHLANARRGNPWLTGAASVTGAVAGSALGMALGGSEESTPVGFGIAIPIMVGAPALVEWLTTR